MPLTCNMEWNKEAFHYFVYFHCTNCAVKMKIIRYLVTCKCQSVVCNSNHSQFIGSGYHRDKRQLPFASQTRSLEIIKLKLLTILLVQVSPGEYYAISVWSGDIFFYNAKWSSMTTSILIIPFLFLVNWSGTTSNRCFSKWSFRAVSQKDLGIGVE